MRTLSLLLVTATIRAAAVTPPEQIKVPPGFKVELLREAAPGEGSWICMTQDDAGRLYIASQDGSFAKDGAWGGIWRVTLGKGSAQSSVLSSQSGKADVANPKLSTEHWALSTPAEMKWERVQVPISDAMGMLWAFDSLYVSGMGPQGRGIYRCKDTKHDGNLDTATLFKAIPGGAGEHGAHAIILGPDKKLYIVNGNSTGILDGLSPDSPYRNWGEDDLLPRLRDPVATFFDKLKAPYGCVYRTDADGTKWELFAGGFRNPYDIAFNPDGELFTYDSDMEWDRGLPWYRPTRILHVVPGGEYGFREGSAKWPAYFPDSLPAVADIGVGCPTGMAFYPGSPDVGTDAKGWPEKYRRALFLHDWTYGRILAVTLHEKGASYTARNDLASYTYPRDAEVDEKGDVEVFLSGKGMPVTDLEFLRDGSMVFTVGGRGTAAALYRVSWMGENTGVVNGAQKFANGETRTTDFIVKPEDVDPLKELEKAAEKDAPVVQRKLAGGAASEANATTGSPSAKTSAPAAAPETLAAKARRMTQHLMASGSGGPAWTLTLRLLDESHDPFAAFATIRDGEHRDENFTRPPAVREARRMGISSSALLYVLASARGNDASTQEEILEFLKESPLAKLSDDLKLLKLRVLELSFARQGRPSEEWVKTGMEKLLAHYPAHGVPPLGGTNRGTNRGPAGDTPSPKDTGSGLAGALPPKGGTTYALNRELCALLVWLSNPELGALNAALTAKADARAGDATKATGNSQPPATETTAPRQVANLPYIGPVPNPGADIFPGRKGAAFHTELGRQVIEKTLALMDSAPSQEEQIWYALCLRWAHGWTPELRVRYFRWFHEKASRYTGGNSFAKFVEAIRADAASRVPWPERVMLSYWMRPVAAPTPAAALKPRAFVKAWTLPELEAALDKLKDRKPDLARGRELYTQAQCAQCHLFRDAGGNVGPDLSAVAQRFGRHDILESITDPSKVVSEQYAMVTLTVLDGKGGTMQVSGLVKEESSATMTLLTDPLTGGTWNVYKNVVVKTEKAAASTMPPGLLNTLTAEEVADLLALFGTK